MNLCILTLLNLDRFELSKGIDVNETRKSKECNIGHCWYFLNIAFKYQKMSAINFTIY